MNHPESSPPADPRGPAATATAKPPAGDAGTSGPNDASWDDDEDGEEWRHAPVAPKDENVLDSLGRSISEVVTGADSDENKKKNEDKNEDKDQPPGRT